MHVLWAASAVGLGHDSLAWGRPWTSYRAKGRLHVREVKLGCLSV